MGSGSFEQLVPLFIKLFLFDTYIPLFRAVHYQEL